MLKKTKIVATMGPSTSSKEVLKEMMLNGLDVCRLNFSHGSYEDHKKSISLIHELNEELNLRVSILGDLQGPKIRTHLMEGDCIEILEGKKLKISTVNKIVGNSDKISINYESLAKDVKVDDRILLDDGKIVLKVLSSNSKDEIITQIVNGGKLYSNKGVNFPNTKISQPSLTSKDKEDLNFVLENNLDWVALSFVRSARDIIELKHIISTKNSNAKVIAKIEKPEALIEIDDIIKESDALMVARGDLGVEIPYQEVPLIQKRLIQKCRQNAKPVIVATQMMESMMSNLTPTRAEVNDVANAVLDGTDAVMLSGETSVGKYPIKVINVIHNIIDEMEKAEEIYHKEEAPMTDHDRFITDSICFNACRLALRVNACAILTMSFSGYTAFKISSQRPKAPVYVFTSNRKILTQLNLLWGVHAFYYNKRISTDHTIADIKYVLKKKNILKTGDVVINIASIPLEDLGGSNMLKLSVVD